jgi:ADP-ribose pyrophosphatase YjhB (NUDIX family)
MTFKNRLLKSILWFSKITSIPIDFFARRYPVSAKGILIQSSKVLLLKNERDEWDLPGGKLNNSDLSLEYCLKREVREETNLDVEIKGLEGTFVINIHNWVKVIIIVYQCKIISNGNNLEISGEHYDKAFFSADELNSIKINPTYKEIIQNILN